MLSFARTILFSITYRRFPVFSALVEPGAVAIHLQDVDVMGEVVELGSRQALGAKYFCPLVERHVAGHQVRSAGGFRSVNARIKTNENLAPPHYARPCRPDWWSTTMASCGPRISIPTTRGVRNPRRRSTTLRSSAEWPRRQICKPGQTSSRTGHCAAH